MAYSAVSGRQRRWEQVLQDQGMRLTKPRLQVLEAIVRGSDPFTAEDVEKLAPKVGRATVYRSLKLLVEMGILCKVFLDNGSPRYSFSAQEHHHHLVCVACGSVREFRQSVIEQVLAQLEILQAGTIMGHRMEVFVLCPACQKAGPRNRD
jgi:Fe2+ or Zn2+ uptake regulation protein